MELIIVLAWALLAGGILAAISLIIEFIFEGKI
jgi:hypothetical protein